jgi:hypothetical protein
MILDRHNARQKLTYGLLPDPPHFSLPSTFKMLYITLTEQIIGWAFHNPLSLQHNFSINHAYILYIDTMYLCKYICICPMQIQYRMGGGGGGRV